MKKITLALLFVVSLNVAVFVSQKPEMVTNQLSKLDGNTLRMMRPILRPIALAGVGLVFSCFTAFMNDMKNHKD